jgi:hypothetical protein
MTRDLRLEYQAGEDRLVLNLIEGAAVRRFWLTRRQCLALVMACGPEASASAAKPKVPAGAAARSGGLLASPGAAPAAGAAPGGAVEASPPAALPSLARLGLRRAGEELRLSLTAEVGPPLRLRLTAADQARLVGQLHLLARRAQWDLPEAVARLVAQAAASQARRTLH